MSAFKKFLPGKKKSKKSSAASLRSATSEPNVADGFEPGYRNVKEKDLPKLHKAAWNGDFAKIKQLLSKKGDINQMDKHHRTALHYACVRGSNDITQWLCTNRAKLGICDADGRTALMKAVECANENCIETLLNHGAETNVVDVSLATPLHLTATHGSIPIATMLLERDARVNAADIEKITPLHVAASLGFPEFVEFLLKEYSLVNEVDAYGRTPLIAGAMEGHIAVVKLLLEYGADTEIKDSEGWKAADHAAMSGNHSISHMIEETVKREEPQAAQPDSASNYGSGIGSPFKSNSTQPVSSIFGGPAINLNDESEDESTKQESPIRPDLQNSWADSGSDVEEEPIKEPSLATALRRNESAKSSKSVSRIPLASPSKENLIFKKGGSSTSLDTAKTASSSKIPRFGSGNAKQNPKSSKESNLSPPQPAQKHQSKIPMAKETLSASTSPENDVAKNVKAADTGSHGSKIPRFSASPLLTRKDAAAEKTGSKIAKGSEVLLDKKVAEDKKDEPNDFGNSDFSDWDSDSEEFSETDVLAALSGNPLKKKSEDSKTKINLKERFSMFQATSAANANGSEGTESQAEPEAKEEHQNEAETNQDEDSHQIEASKDQNVDGTKATDEKSGQQEISEWESSSEEVSVPKAAVMQNNKAAESEMEAKESAKTPEKKNVDLDLDLGWETSEATTPISSPEFVKKPQTNMNAEVKTPEANGNNEAGLDDGETPVKDNPESEFSDFSLQESEKVDNDNETPADNKANENEKTKDKAKQDRKAQLSALGLDLGSSFSSVSESEDFGELDTSLTKHDQLFQTKETPKAKEDDTPKDGKGSGHPEEAELKDTIDSGLGKTGETQRGNGDATAAAKSASKAQYDALGIDLSETEESVSVTESESEWERSLQKKKELKKAEAAEGKENEAGKMMTELKGDTETESEAEVVIENNLKLENSDEDGQVSEEAGKDAFEKDVKDSEIADSKFISDENFSIDTEDQLEALESERLKAADGKDEEGSNLSGDFNDGSDFSYTDSKQSEQIEENSKNEIEVDGSENEASADDTEVEEDRMDIKEEVDNGAANTTDAVGEDQSKNEEVKSKNQLDMERMKILQGIANSNGVKDDQIEQRETSAPPERKFSVPRKLSDDVERKQKLEAMVRPMNIKKIEQPIVESGVEVRDENQLFSAQEEDLSNALEDEFERQLVQKEEESKKEAARKEEESRLRRIEEENLKKEAEERRMIADKERRREEEQAVRRREEEQEMRRREEEQEMRRREEEQETRRKQEELAVQRREEEARIKTEEDDRRRADEDRRRRESERRKLKEDQQSLEAEKRIKEDNERRRKEEEFELQMKLKEEQKQQELEAEAKRTIEIEKERIKQEDELKRHQEDLLQHEKLFEEELQKRESEEKQKRKQRLAIREKEREELKEKQIKGIEDEYARIQEEKLMWDKRREEQAENFRKDQLELDALAKKRIQEELKANEASMRLKQQEQIWEQQQAAAVPNDTSAELRRRELEELMRIEGLLKDSTNREEERKIKEHKIFEDLIPTKQSSKDRDLRPFEEDVISPIKSSSQLTANNLGQISLKPSPTSEEAQKRLNQSKQMRDEAEQLLQAARDKTNAIMTGQRYGSPPLRLPNSNMAPQSEYAPSNYDEDLKTNFNGVNSNDMKNLMNKPRSEVPDIEMLSERGVGFPATSSPYQPLRHSLDPRFSANEDLSPVMRPKSAPGFMDEEREKMPAYKTATPMALYNSLSQAGHFQDSKALMKMQDSLRDAKRELEKSRNRNVAMENSKREMEVDMREMQRAVEILSKSQADFERFRLEAEMELRETKYRLDQELEAKAATEGLNAQLKEQLKRAEDKLASEGEARQTIELAYKTMEAEFKIRENLVNQFENDVNDLRYSLNHEREARINQEKMYTEQLEQHEALLEEAQHTSYQHAQTVGQLEAVDINRKSAEAAADNLKIEFAKAKGELTRVTSQLEEVKSTYENEVSRLRTKLQEKSDAVVLSEREQFQAQMKMEAERSTAKADQLRLASSLENEVANKKRIQTELNVLRNQLQNANNELERIGKNKSLAENEVSRFKEETYKDRNKQDRELTAAKEELQRTSAKLDNMERRCDSIDSELQGANIALAEKSGQLVMANREMEYKNNILNQLEEKVRSEKELNQRLVNKIEAQNERTAIFQREIDNLRRELDAANQRAVAYDKSSRDSQERFKMLLAGTKEDYDKERVNLEARLEHLNEAVIRYKSELAEATAEIKQKENDIRNIEKDMNNLSRNLSAVEASNEIQTKTRQQLEGDKTRLGRESAVLERNVADLETQRNELLCKVDDLTEQLEHTLKVSDHTNNKLAQRTADAHVAKQTRADLEKSMMRVKVEKAELESELREEKAQSEMLLDDLRKSNDARESLEKILSNVKSSNMHLEEKLQSETISRVQRERDADDHKDLWNSEVKSRSKLGLKLVQMEKEVDHFKTKLEEEKRNTIIAIEGKKSIEAKLELYDKRALQHQKEFTAIRSKLKQYQRRLKDYENGESKLPKAYAEFERERDLMLNNTSNLRRQMDNVNDQLRQEQENRSRAEILSKQNQHELTELRTKEKILSYEREKLQKENQMLEDEMERLKAYYERNFVDKNNVGAFKKDIETKARLEINRKLQEVNMQLEEQAIARETYDRVRNENESKSKKELETTISSLRGELAMVKSALQEGLTKTGTYETEASRLKELYQSEVADKHKLSEQVSKLTDRFADSTARLSLEKSRNQQLMDFTSSLRVSPLKSSILPGEREDYLRSTLRNVDAKPLAHRDVDSYISPVLRRNFLS